MRLGELTCFNLSCVNQNLKLAMDNVDPGFQKEPAPRKGLVSVAGYITMCGVICAFGRQQSQLVMGRDPFCATGHRRRYDLPNFNKTT